MLGYSLWLTDFKDADLVSVDILQLCLFVTAHKKCLNLNNFFLILSKLFT